MADREKVILPVKGYEGYYSVDNFGNVYSEDRIIVVTVNGKQQEKHIKGKRMIPQVGATGYESVMLSKNGRYKMARVHRLVAEAFIPNPNNLPIINHKDENRINNSVDNLEWCDNSYNVRYNGASKRAGEKKRGRKWTEEHKNKISDSVKEYYTCHESALKGKPVSRRKPVILTSVYTGDELYFDYVMAAGAFVGDTRGSNVRRAIKNGSTVKGYYARYAERGK